MSAQLKTHLAVYGGGRTIIKKMIDWETHVQFQIHSNARAGPAKNNIFSFQNISDFAEF